MKNVRTPQGGFFLTHTVAYMIYMISEHVPSLYSLDVVGYCQLQDKFWAAETCNASGTV